MSEPVAAAFPDNWPRGLPQHHTAPATAKGRVPAHGLVVAHGHLAFNTRALWTVRRALETLARDMAFNGLTLLPETDDLMHQLAEALENNRCPDDLVGQYPGYPDYSGRGGTQ